MSETMASMLECEFALVQHPARTSIDKVILTRYPEKGGVTHLSREKIFRNEFQNWLALTTKHGCS